MKLSSILFTMLILSATLACAQESEDESLQSPATLNPGLTRKQVTSALYVVTAEDAKVATDGKKTYYEDIYEYLDRKFKAVEERLIKIEAEQEEMRGKIKQLAKDLTGLKKPAE